MLFHNLSEYLSLKNHISQPRIKHLCIF